MSHAALRTILPVAGWNTERARAVEITRVADPILPTPFRIGETSAAALAAVGLAVSELWELRTGRRQEVAVDTRQATASLRSGHYMKMDGAPVSTERNVVMASIPPRTAAGAISTATSRTIVPPRSACSACRKIARRCAKQ